MSNRVLQYAANIKARLTELDSDAIARLDEANKLEFGELAAYQNLKSRALLEGKITLDEANTIYQALGEGTDWKSDTPLEMKITVTKLISELMGIE